MNGTPPPHVTQLGQQTPLPESPETAVLERVPNPHADTLYVARFTQPEFTSLCPVTGQPDFAHLVIDYVPRDGLLKLSLVNFLLGIVTLTIYRFWARTNVRRHIWSCVHINGQPLEYTGKGGEPFKGALIVFAVLGLPVILAVSAISIAYGPEHPAVAGIQTLVFLIVSILWGAALFRARRYQLSRTLWRGIRGGLEGSATTYSLTYFGALLVLAAGMLFLLLRMLQPEKLVSPDARTGRKAREQ